MPKVLEYDHVLQTLTVQGFKSLYYNSGSFAFRPEDKFFTQGWLGPPDSTIRADALSFTRQIQPPFSANLAQFTQRVWSELVPGAVWIMPRSHWAYELDFGSKDWMPGALRAVGIEKTNLEFLTTGTAIEFEPYESNEFGSFLTSLLDNLSGSSDFQIAWPGRPLLCTVHHHQQLWWTTTDETIFRRLDALVA
jgi:hypothetical protein